MADKRQITEKDKLMSTEILKNRSLVSRHILVKFITGSSLICVKREHDLPLEFHFVCFTQKNDISKL